MSRAAKPPSPSLELHSDADCRAALDFRARVGMLDPRCCVMSESQAVKAAERMVVQASKAIRRGGDAPSVVDSTPDRDETPMFFAMSTIRWVAGKRQWNKASSTVPVSSFRAMRAWDEGMTMLQAYYDMAWAWHGGVNTSTMFNSSICTRDEGSRVMTLRHSGRSAMPIHCCQWDPIYGSHGQLSPYGGTTVGPNWAVGLTRGRRSFITRNAASKGMMGLPSVDICADARFG